MVTVMGVTPDLVQGAQAALHCIFIFQPTATSCAPNPGEVFQQQNAICKVFALCQTSSPPPPSSALSIIAKLKRAQGQRPALLSNARAADHYQMHTLCQNNKELCFNFITRRKSIMLSMQRAIDWDAWLVLFLLVLLLWKHK